MERKKKQTLSAEIRFRIEREMLDNLKDTLVGLHGAKVTRDVNAYHEALHDGCDPEGAWSVFVGTLQEVDVWQELEDIDSLLERIGA